MLAKLLAALGTLVLLGGLLVIALVIAEVVLGPSVFFESLALIAVVVACLYAAARRRHA
jgi:hypothetical protein